MAGQLLTKNAKAEMYSKVFSLLRSAEPISPLSTMLGVSVMPQPDSISSRVESVLVGPSASLMLALPQHLRVLFYRTAIRWTHPLEMVDSHLLEAGHFAKS